MARRSQRYDSILVKQLNMHHCKGATALISNSMNLMQTSDQKTIFLIQEPWLRKEKIHGLSSRYYNLFQSTCASKKRTCIIAPKDLSVTLLPQFCNRDHTTVLLNTGISGRNEEIILCSGYMPYEDAYLPNTYMKSVIEYASDAGIPFIMGCDTNAHHTIWGSSNINPRGNVLLEYIASTNLDILNRGAEPTFVNAIRSEVLDVTFASHFFTERITNWQVSSEETLSDHKEINFNILMEKREGILFRNPRNTSWENFRTLSRENQIDLPQSEILTTADLDTAVEALTSALFNAFVSSCPGRLNEPRKNQWWNRELQTLKKSCRNLYRIYRRSPEESKANHWGNYKKKRNEYGQEILKSKENSAMMWKV